MQHHDRRAGSVARADINDVQSRAFDLDHAAWRWMSMLQGKHAGLRDGRQHGQRRHDKD